MSSSVVLFFQILLWWAANNIFAIDVHYLVAKYPPHLFIDLTFIHLLIGLILSSILHYLSIRNHPHANPVNPFTSIPISPTLTIAALLHLLATALTNASYKLIGASGTLVWKLSEPLTTIILKRVILKESTSPLSLTGVAFVLIGVLIFSSSKLTVITVSPIVLANLAFPTRNVLIKLDQRRASTSQQPMSPQHVLYSLHVAAIPFAAVVLLAKLVVTGPSFSALPLMLRSAMLFNTYQFASLAILHKLDPLTHSLANTLKRFTAILLALLVLRETFTAPTAIGLLCALVGFPLYIFGGNINMQPALSKVFVSKSPSRVASSATKALYVALPLLMILTFPLSSTNSIKSIPIIPQVLESIHIPMQSVSRNHTLQSAYENSISASQYTVVLPDRLGMYSKEKRQSIRFSGYKSMNIDGNAGDHVWRHGAYIMLPDFSQTNACNASVPICMNKLNPEPGPNSKLILYRPVANYFNDRREQPQADLKYMQGERISVFFVGIGVQSFFTYNKSFNDLTPGMKIETRPENFQFADYDVELLKAAQEKEQPILFRGTYTRNAARSVGYTHGVALGCPSLMISEEVRLGEILEAKYEKLRSRVFDKTLKIAINMKQSTKYMELCLSILANYPNSIMYIQDRGDSARMQNFGIPFSRIRRFDNVDDWMESLSKMDVSIGARIHGNMLALSVGVPVYIIAPDHRVLELAERMKVPHTTWYDEKLSTNAKDLMTIVGSIEFDGKSFDNNRCEIAKTYRKMFAKYGIGVASHVRRIAGQC